MNRFLCFLMLILSLTNFKANALLITDMVVFGDSLSDSGNLYLISGQPPAPYQDGHFSNGPVYGEYLSNYLQLGPLMPAVLGGKNFAWGGAMASEDVPISGGAIPGIQTQVAQYLGSGQSSAIDSGTLAIMFIGNNDVAGAITQNLTPQQATPFFSLGVQQILNSVQELNLAGIEHFLIPEVPDWALTPRFLGNQNASELSELFNVMVSTALNSLNDIDIISFDTTDFFLEHRNLFAKPDTACLAEGCQSPDDYIFFDDIHPTTKAHALFAQNLRTAVNAPTTIFLFFMGLSLLLIKQRKKGLTVNLGA